MLLSGGVLAWTGTHHLLDVFGQSQAWSLSDPLLGIPFRVLMPLAGLAELFVAGFCLFSKRRTLSLGLVAWLTITFLVYRVCLWSMGWPHPYVWLSGLINGLNVSPHLADVVQITIVTAFFFSSSAALCSKRGDVAVRDNQSSFAKSLKMVCVLCGGHIEFPDDALGQKIQCPHCSKNITLLSQDKP